MIFSVVIPTHNRTRSIEKVLGAIKDQDFDPREFEAIVIDDGSEDGTREYLANIAKDWPSLVVLEQKNQGPAAARNLGISRASGQIIAFTDDDCLVGSDWLSRLYRGWKMFPEAGGVGGFLEAPPQILKSNLIAGLEFFETHTIYQASQNPYLGGFESPAGGTNNMSYRKDVLQEVGGFDESFPVPAGEDADLKLRVVKRGYSIGYLPIKVTHLDSYSWPSFLRRSFVHGIGSAAFESKHLTPPTIKSVIRDFFLLGLTFPRMLRQSKNPKLSLLMMVKNSLMIAGKVIYIYRR